jgi:hypothetical protein
VSEGRDIVAEFHKDSSGRLTLWSLTAMGHALGYRTTYDIEHSRRYGYIFDQCGAGGSDVVEVSGIYFASGDVKIKEKPTAVVDARDNPPWRSKRTRAIRERNRTRRLRTLPRAFALQPGWDLLDWLEHNAIQETSVYCSVCRDRLPDGGLCEHCWWCDTAGWYSTPSERCECKDREACRG